MQQARMDLGCCEVREESGFCINKKKLKKLQHRVGDFKQLNSCLRVWQDLFGQIWSMGHMAGWTLWGVLYLPG